MTIYYLASDVSLSLPDASSKRKHHLFVVRTVPQASGRPSNKPIKPILLVLLNLVITVQVSIAQITRNDVLPLFAKLGKENFKGAQQLSAELLKEFKKDTTSLVGIVRYAYLYSSAALVSKGEMSY